MTCIEVKNKGIRDLKDMTFSMSVGMVGRSSKPGECVLCSELRLPPPEKPYKRPGARRCGYCQN